MIEIINIVLNGYDKCKKYIGEFDLVMISIIAIIALYFGMYIISFFFKLPFIILVGSLIGYLIYKKNGSNKKIKSI